MPRLLWCRSSKWRLVVMIVLGLAVESIIYQYYCWVPRPFEHGDPPFQIGCQEPKTDGPRANATIIMLAQNEDQEKAVAAIESLEEHFNRWYHYPVTFVNNQRWSQKFIDALTKAVSGEAKFEVLPREMFDFPDWMDKDKARQALAVQEQDDVYKGGSESYHHMCRFYSGKFYDVEALKGYQWYWRIEPHVQFTCAITYDPFIEMAKRGKKYGYTVIMWELENTVQSLFRAVSDFKKERKIRTTALWKSMIRQTWLPYPWRIMKSSLPAHDASGDEWNLCHFWSNFEIADMDFFRSQEYRDLFEYLDNKGGFYSERWGDAPVHSLAAAMLLEPHELHHFEDVGYMHEPYMVCPANAQGKQLPDSKSLGAVRHDLGPERDGGSGCRCECKERRNFQNWCMNKIQRGTHPKAWPNKMGW